MSGPLRSSFAYTAGSVTTTTCGSSKDDLNDLLASRQGLHAGINAMSGMHL